jgi:preprotein translocase subunit SecF
VELFPHDSKFDFMRLRTVTTAVSVLLLVLALGALAVRGLSFALDFTGGSVIELEFEKPVELGDLRARLEEAGYRGAVVQSFGALTDVVVRLQPRTEQENSDQTGGAVLEVLDSPESPARLMRSDFVGPQVGKELAENGILAVVFVALGFLVYISARFEWKFAVAAIATTLFDVVVTTGWFAVTQHEFDLTVLAGVLSVMGYSINDKIVVFDRVRENFKALHKIGPGDVLNRSINQTLSRTVIVSFVAFLTVVALYIFGGGSLRGMAESQMIGIVLGTLSSIFVACPLLLWLGVTKQDLMPKAKDLSELERRP